MKIGIVGLGDIAQKAYLPVLTEKEGIELVLCTRNGDKLKQLAEKYRIPEYVQSVEELIETGVEAVFVSAATEAHFGIAKQVLEAGIHVYVDKPLSLNYEESVQLVRLAEEKGIIAMVGFNRRFAPMIAKLKENGKPDLVIIQKNRFQQPDHTRRFVVEDFVHVVDTLRFLMDTPVQELSVRYLEKDGLLHNLVIQLAGNGITAIGMMNRNNGVTEEIIEYMTPEKKVVVDGLAETTEFHDKDELTRSFGDWEPTLAKRGFYNMVDHFIESVENKTTPSPSFTDSLKTHKICEEIVRIIEAGSKETSSTDLM